MIYTRPLAMTGVDWPGKSATHNASLVTSLSGRFFSSDVPFCCGPRQASQPRTGAAEERKEGRSAMTSPSNNGFNNFILSKSRRFLAMVSAPNRHSRQSSTPREQLQSKNNTHTYDPAKAARSDQRRPGMPDRPFRDPEEKSRACREAKPAAPPPASAPPQLAPPRTCAGRALSVARGAHGDL